MCTDGRVYMCAYTYMINIYTCIYRHTLYIYLYIWIDTHKEIYSKELTGTTLEFVDKSQDLQSAGQSPRSGWVPGWVCRPEIWESWRCASSWRLASSRPRKSSASVKQRTNAPAQRQSGRQEGCPLTTGKVSLLFLVRLAAEWRRPTMLGRAIRSTQATNLNAEFIWKHRNTQNNSRPNMWAPHGPIKLTHQINHHHERL